MRTVEEIKKDLEFKMKRIHELYLESKDKGHSRFADIYWAQFSILDDVYKEIYLDEDCCRECGDIDSLNEVGADYICSSCLSD